MKCQGQKQKFVEEASEWFCCSWRLPEHTEKNIIEVVLTTKSYFPRHRSIATKICVVTQKHDNGQNFQKVAKDEITMLSKNVRVKCNKTRLFEISFESLGLHLN